MQTIEERSGGRWRPSPGSVYPTLAQLEDEGLIKSAEADGSRRFEITDAGREHLETRADEPEPWKPADEEGENAITELAPLVIQIGKAAWRSPPSAMRRSAHARSSCWPTRAGLCTGSSPRTPPRPRRQTTTPTTPIPACRRPRRANVETR